MNIPKKVTQVGLRFGGSVDDFVFSENKVIDTRISFGKYR